MIVYIGSFLTFTFIIGAILHKLTGASSIGVFAFCSLAFIGLFI